VTVSGFIAAQRTDYGIPHTVACRALDVSESWFYKWKDRPLTTRQQRRERLRAEVQGIFCGSERTYGSPRVHRELRDRGWVVTRRTVAELMAADGLAGRPKKRRRSLTRQDRKKVPFKDLVRRDFTAPAPDVKWCGDLTEIPTLEGTLYLASVEDLFSRRLLGFAMSEHPDAVLARDAIQMAVAVRGGSVTGVISHTARGSTPTPPTSSPRPAGITGSRSRWAAPVNAWTRRGFHTAPPGDGWVRVRLSSRLPWRLMRVGSPGVGGSKWPDPLRVVHPL
jgi:putative transposase